MKVRENIIWLFLALWGCCMSQVLAKDVRTHSLIEFEQYFDQMRANRIRYRAYNDSIFLIHNHAKWARFFLRRSVEIHRIYDSNSQLSQKINRRLLEERDTLSLNTYRFFLDTFRKKFVDTDMGDPFGVFSACRLLDRINKNIAMKDRGLNLINLWRIYSYMQMHNLVSDSTYVKRAYECGKFLLSEEAKLYPDYDYVLPRALRYMTKPVWVVNRVQTIAEYTANIKRLDEYLSEEHTDSILPPALRQDLEQVRETADESLVRNTYLVDASTMSEQEADSLMRAVVKKNLATPNLSALSHVRTLYMQMELGQISAKEARRQSLIHYNKVWRRIKDRKLDAKQLNDYLQPFYTFFAINHRAEVSVAEKRKTVWRMCQDMVHAFMNRKDQQQDTDFARDMNAIVSYRRVSMYLSHKQLLKFFTALNVATQVTSHAHALHVAMIARELSRDILKYQPELFTQLQAYPTVEAVKKQKRQIMKFAYEAGYYHDVGKSALVTVANTEYRPLIPEEFQILKLHPKMAQKIFDLVPELAKYRDTTLGHHKWYDGKGGYPEDFDNTKSPVRFFIDIVSLSDCLQAATEKIARNYRYAKNFEVVMQELREGAGTQYNPQLVEFIDQHPDVKARLNHLITDGWIKVYYKIYRKYFKYSL